jgi:hypothetical protein
MANLDYNRLNQVVETISSQLSDPSLRQLNNRAIQAKIWSDPTVASYMTDLRNEEENVRKQIMTKMSSFIQQLHLHCINATLSRANIIQDERISKNQHEKDFDLICLDAKERLYLILNEYGWMKDFFRLYPMHFFENSFQFVNNIPAKELDHIKVKVVGLGVGGSLAVSGLKKRGIRHVVGYDKRARYGERSVTSRYQNASWRAYDIAQGLLDKEAYDTLVAYQQRIHIVEDGNDDDDDDDGSGSGMAKTTKVMTSDRVQIILGSAIDSALASAERYGADLQFNSTLDNFYKSSGSNVESKDKEKVDIVALFTGAHTSNIFDGLKDQMKIFEWPNLSSKCKMWLQIKPSRKKYAFTARDIEVGAENWHFAIESARNTINDVNRIRDSLTSQYQFQKNKLKQREQDPANSSAESTCQDEEKTLEENYLKQLAKIDTLIETIESAQKEDSDSRFDYIFANAPDNEHNRSKIDDAKRNGNVVIDGNYQVDVKIASNAAIDIINDNSSNEAKKICDKFSSNVVVMGGDACVPPNPMAAYGATLACEFAEMLVQLAVSHGHLNSIMAEFKNVDDIDTEWINNVKELKGLFTQYYDARGKAENYFQWMQTLICNLYSLPPIE